MYEKILAENGKIITRLINNWMEFKELTLTPRSGYAKYGIYPDPDPLDYSRWESDLEHTAGLWKLVKLIQQNFPEQFFKYWELQDALEIADIHEIGEKITGDICDDGERDNATLDLVERQFIRETYLVGYSKSTAEHLFELFCQFQNRSTRFGQTMYCCDKAEAMLQGLLYEKQKRGGHLLYANAAPLEIEGARVANTDRLVDVWLYSFVKNAKKYEYFDFFIALIVCAARMVRKVDDPFPWLKPLLEEN